MTIGRIVLIAALVAAYPAIAVSQTAQPAAKPATTAPAPAAAPAAKPAAAAPAAKPAAATPVAKKVNLNTAKAAELDALPQIGEARSKAIMDARKKSKFKNWDDFVARKVIPANAEDAIKNLVSF